jgi:MFS family permease
MILGMVVGAVPADRVAARLGPKITVALGFTILAAGMLTGSALSASSSDAFLAVFTFVVGVGAGMGLSTAASAAMVEISAERSGVGGAVVQAVIKLGPAFGTSILGSVLNGTYQSHVDVAGLPPTAAAAAQESVFKALAVARQIGSPSLAESAKGAFVAGIDDALRAAAVVAVAAIVGALLLLPRRAAAHEAPDADPGVGLPVAAEASSTAG